MGNETASGPQIAASYDQLAITDFVLYTATFPRVHATSLPPAQQAAFANFYPNGLPVTYNMVHGHDSSGIAKYYLENHLPCRFYTQPPAGALGKFSTINGQMPFRELGELLPERRIHLWNRDEIQSVCNSIRKRFWSDIMTMHRPLSVDDLWHYFDGYDLYHYGSLNLWNVVQHMYDENRLISSEIAVQKSLEIGNWADNWVEKSENRGKLKRWTEDDGPILCVFSGEDWRSLGNLKDNEISVLKMALRYRRLGGIASGGRARAKRPENLGSAYQSGNVVNWLGPPPPFPLKMILLRSSSVLTLLTS